MTSFIREMNLPFFCIKRDAQAGHPEGTGGIPQSKRSPVLCMKCQNMRVRFLPEANEGLPLFCLVTFQEAPFREAEKDALTCHIGRRELQVQQ